MAKVVKKGDKILVSFGEWRGWDEETQRHEGVHLEIQDSDSNRVYLFDFTADEFGKFLLQHEAKGVIEWARQPKRRSRGQRNP